MLRFYYLQRQQEGCLENSISQKLLYWMYFLATADFQAAELRHIEG